MKKISMVLLTLIMLLGITTTTNAFIVGENYIVTNSDVKFYLVDWAPSQFNNQVIMSASTLGASLGSLQYSLDGTIWNNFSISGTTGIATIAISSSNHTQAMYLKYGTDTTADSMTFTSWTTNSSNNTTPTNLDLFTGLVINFDSTDYTKITFLSNTDNDKFAPIPIPPSVWLLGAGLVGLFGTRRRFWKTQEKA